MNLHLVDLDREVAAALKEAFAAFPEVTVAEGEILREARTSIVSPANGYGFMDGGIDAAYRKHFGPGIEATVRDKIAARTEGHLPVGASLVVRTGDELIPFMIVAPTMLMPEAVPATHAGRAMMAILRVADAAGLGEVYCPGLATGVGAVPPAEAASAMAGAYKEWQKRKANQTVETTAVKCQPSNHGSLPAVSHL